VAAGSAAAGARRGEGGGENNLNLLGETKPPCTSSQVSESVAGLRKGKYVGKMRVK
jgi:hypothetical protein